MKKIKNSKHTKNIIGNDKQSKSINNTKIIDYKIMFRFSDFYLNSIQLKNFTNYFKSINESHKNFLNLFELLKFYNQINSNEISLNKHFHIIEGIEYSKCIEILKKYNNTIKIDTLSLYSIGLKQGLRVIGQKMGVNIFEILFLDPHHLIYNSIKYNDKDYMNYNFCPINNK